jgi:DMSO/TMAO reductase YedYZ molybdopterin-dependent catalytic subunit
MDSIHSHGRLPPGQRLRKNFPVLHYGEIPGVELERWEFKIKGLVRKPLVFSYENFLKLPSIEIVTDFHCVTGWSKFDIRWKGVLFKTIVMLAEPLPDAGFVNITSYGGYTTNLPLKIALEPDVLFAYEIEGNPLPPEHGYPLRLVVPRRYAYKSAKWVREVEFLEHDRPGFWESRGYSNSADPWKEERYAT